MQNHLDNSDILDSMSTWVDCSRLGNQHRQPLGLQTLHRKLENSFCFAGLETTKFTAHCT